MNEKVLYRDAVVSDCGQYRYRLTRVWDSSLPRAAFIMLNPSVADSARDDPTIRKCIGFAQRLGFGSFDVVNLFAFRATDPMDLFRAGYPRGPLNHQHVEEVVKTADTVVCAWGATSRLAAPGQMLQNLKTWGIRPMALRLNKKGSPGHPLMLPYTCTLQPMTRAI